jgi:hypothetical protein
MSAGPDGAHTRLTRLAFAAVVVLAAAVLAIWLRGQGHVPEEPLPTHTPESPAPQPANRAPRRSCEGEPVEPLATASLPGEGAVDSVAAHCAAGTLRVAARVGSRLYLLVRPSAAGARWGEAGSASHVADGVAESTEVAVSSPGFAWFAWLAEGHARVGVARLAATDAVAMADLPRPHEGGELFAVGGTERFTYLATWEGPRFGHRSLLFRVPLPGGPAAVTTFDLGPGDVRSVRPSESRPTLLIASDDPREGRSLTTRTIDLAALDSVPGGSRDAPIPIGDAIATRGGSIPVQGIPEAATRGVSDPPVFLVASAAASGIGDGGCDGRSVGNFCYHVVEPRLARLDPHGAINLGAPIAERGVPLAISPHGSGFAVALAGPDRRVRWIGTDAEGRPTPPADAMPGVTGLEVAHATVTRCGETDWAVLGGTRPDGHPGVAAVPLGCVVP